MTNTYYVAGIPFNSHDSLTHHGIKGQKWGVRRFQNQDGTLTAEGKKRYDKYDSNRSREELGINTKGHINAVQRRLSNKYKSAMNKYQKQVRKIGKGNQSEKDTKRLTDTAKAFLNEANVQKSLAQTYTSLTAKEQKAINAGYRKTRRISRALARKKQFLPTAIRTGRRDADTYLSAELLARKDSKRMEG